MFGEARPVCPTCGASLFPRKDGELACNQHGTWYPAAALDAGLGPGTAAASAGKAVRGTTVGRKCPHDRLAMGAYASPSGRVTVEGCSRCGGVWLPSPVLDAVVSTTPAPAGLAPADARAMLGWAAVRGAVAAAPAAGRPR